MFKERSVKQQREIVSEREAANESIKEKEKEIQSLEEDKANLEVDLSEKRVHYEELQQKHEEEFAAAETEYDAKIEKNREELKDLEQRIQAIAEFKKEQEHMQAALQSLKEALAREIEEHKRDSKVICMQNSPSAGKRQGAKPGDGEAAS